MAAFFSVTAHRAWTLIRKLRRFELPELRRRLEISPVTLHHWFACLEESGYLERVAANPEQFPQKPDRWLLVRDTGPAAPIRRSNGTLYDPNLAGEVELDQQRLWNTWRIHRQLTVEDALRNACLDSEQTTRLYLRAMVRHGYAVVTNPRKNPRVYLLVRHELPLAPIRLRDHRVFDPNINQFVEVPNG